MNWYAALNQSDPSIQLGSKQFVHRSAATGYNSSSYKVSIGHETVSITEITRHGEPRSDPTTTTISTERRHIITAGKDADILSLCFMCFVSAFLILIAITTMHLLLKTNYINHNDMIPMTFQSTNITPGFLYMFATPTSTDAVSNLIVSMYNHIIRDLATVVCLSIIALNCFCLLVFSIETYLGCNMIKTKNKSSR